MAHAGQIVGFQADLSLIEVAVGSGGKVISTLSRGVGCFSGLLLILLPGILCCKPLYPSVPRVTVDEGRQSSGSKEEGEDA